MKDYIQSLLIAVVALSCLSTTTGKEEKNIINFKNQTISDVVHVPYKFPITVHPAEAKPVVQTNEQMNKNTQQTKSEEYIITAYTAGYESTQKKKGEKGYGVTASGTIVQEGRTIACDKSIPFGTEVYIEGIGDRICEDRGSKIKGNHIDLYMDDLKKAQEFGVQHLQVYKMN